MRWTDNELDLLRKLYYTLPVREVSQLFPRHSWNAIVAKVHYLKKRGWKFKQNDG